MKDFKEQCINLRKKDHSLIEIMKITGRPKTSVFFHIKDIPLSKEKLFAIKRLKGEYIRKFAIDRTGKSLKGYTGFSKWTPDLVLLTSHLIFDGEIKYGGCVYNNRNEMLISRVENHMKKMYAFPPTRYKNVETGVLRISYFNVTLGAYMKKKATDLLSNIETMPIKCKKEFIRAFFDDEGCMDFRYKYKKRRIRGYQKDTKILYLIQKLLLDFNIEAKVVKPNEVVISRKENLLKFQKQINFSKGVYINGNRSNSVWKESLEKRIILEKAIKSFA